MYRESQKIHLIEEVLKIDTTANLNELGTFKNKKGESSKKAFMIL